ncbi:MAG: hypothetical protein QW177_05160 [Candidatus Nitrosotenuis sp.]
MKIIHISVIIGMVIVLAFFTNSVSAHRIYPTPEEFYKESDLIVLGKVLSYDYDKSDIRYHIEVKEYVKKPASFEDAKRIEVFGCNPTPPSGAVIMGGGCQTFELSQDVFFGLEEKPYKKFLISEGFVVENPNCTGEQLVQAINPTSGIGVYQNQKPSPLFVGKKTDIVYDFVNNDLFAKNITIQFMADHAFAVTSGKAFSIPDDGLLGVEPLSISRNKTFSETRQILAPECVKHIVTSASFIPKKPGIYNMCVGEENGGMMCVGGISITDESLPPLKQLKAGVNAQETWCRDGLILALRHDDTPDRIFDNKPACVTPDTFQKLTQRNLALFSFYESRPLTEKLHAARAIIQFSDIPFTMISLDHDQVLAVEIDDSELNKVLDAQDHYDRIIREKIPFNVPIKITFGKYWELGEKDCNKKKDIPDMTCFLDSFRECTPAQIKQTKYTDEGDPITTTAVIEKTGKLECKIHAYYDSKDKWGFYGKYDSLCSRLESQNEFSWIIDQCENKDYSFGFYNQ